MEDERIVSDHEIGDNNVAVCAARPQRLFKTVQGIDANHAFCREVLEGHGCAYVEGDVVSYDVVPQGNQVTSIRQGEAKFLICSACSVFPTSLGG